MKRLFPLREVLMGRNDRGIGLVTVPLNTGNVREFEKEMGQLLENPLGVSESLDRLLGPNTYIWDELQAILAILFTIEEREMIRQAGMRDWEEDTRQGPRGDQKWPNQNEQDRQNMRDLRDIIRQGIQHASRAKY